MSLRDFDESTLWRISAYERLRADTGHSGFARLGATVLPSTLHAELAQLQRVDRSGDVLEVLAACIRHRESALLLLRLGGLVWPLTLFPQHHLYHLPRSIIEPLNDGSRDLSVIAVEPAGLRPPGHVQYERIADRAGYRPLPPLLWALALHAPFGGLIEEIAGRAAYRITADTSADGLAGGALRSSLTRLRSEIASLAQVATWPGMGIERATRLVNGAYLQGGLLVLRTHPAARDAEQSAGLRQRLRRH